MTNKLAQGAEAVIVQGDGLIRKIRLEKPYRHPTLDQKLRKSRTRREAKVLEKLPVPGPKLLSMDDEDMIVEMEYLDGPQLRDALTPENCERYAAQLGKHLRVLHDAGIIHGDLTTSNMIVVGEKIYLIDFGLSFFSEHVEDKATDMHLLKHALAAKHPALNLWDAIMQGYSPDKQFTERFAAVEKRGRYKKKAK